MTAKNLLMAVGIALMIAACGGGGSGSESRPVESRTGYLNIALTDAPVDDVTEVNVQFTGVVLKPASGNEIEIVFDNPKDIDLLTLTGGITAELLPDTPVPAGAYNWIRLAVNAEFDNIFDSYAMLPTGQVELRVPSGGQNGLKLVSGFTVSADRSINIVIDWDLRKALSNPIGQPGLHLRPALRIADMAASGTLSGIISGTWVMQKSCDNDLAAQTGNAVYIYNGTVDTPGDIGDAQNEPLTTATVRQDESGSYAYEVHFLPVGNYTAAFTCQANSDDSESDDDIEFLEPQSFVIEVGATTIVNF